MEHDPRFSASRVTPYNYLWMFNIPGTEETSPSSLAKFSGMPRADLSLAIFAGSSIRPEFLSSLEVADGIVAGYLSQCVAPSI